MPRALELDVDAFPDSPDKCIQTMCTDAFVKDLSVKHVTMSVMERTL